MSQRLMPGNYFIEMAFRRPVTEETLTNALKGMGFANIEFDKSDDSVVGGISITSPTLSRLGGAVNLKSKAVAVPVATSITRALAPSSITPVAAPMTRALASPITPVAPRAPLSAVSIPSAPAQRTISPVAFRAPTAALLAPVNTPLSKSLLAAPAQSFSPLSSSQQAALSTFQAPQSSPIPSQFSTPIATVPSGGSNSLLPYILPISFPGGGGSAEKASSDATPYDGGGGGGAENAAPAEPSYDPSSEAAANNFNPSPGALQDMTVTAMPSDVMSAVQEEVASLTNLSPDFAEVLAQPVGTRWKRWVEWGSPFAKEPAHLSTVSGSEESGITRFRFVASLKTSLTPANMVDMSWVFIRYLGINPFSDLNFQLTPFALRRGAFYEFRFFSRLKANPTKDSVKETMSQMGFDPLKLNLLKKNMRIPHRARVSVNMWLGMGRWIGPDSVVTSEDPFFFENLKEVQP